MAYAEVLALMQILQQLMDPGRFVLYEKQQIESLQEKVSFLHDFLENYSLFTSKSVKNLEIRIRETACKAEDIIESYVSIFLLCGRNRIGRYRTFCLELDTIIEEIHAIQQDLVKVKSILDLIYLQQRNHLPTNGSRPKFSDKIPSMVGLVEDMMKLKDWLTSSSSKREVMSIVGMGGIGKTTFARNLFDDSLIVYHFHVRAWATVSQEYEMHEILARLLDSTSCKLSPEMRKTSSEELAERLYKSLKGKRYLIVMDDIWDTKVWDEINRLFPDDNNGSRVVLTTRLNNVGDHAASTDRLHDMSFLSSSESWNLFCEKAFGGECCPPLLEGIGQEIIKNCRGLPLSIVVVAGMLSVDKTVSYWQTIAKTLNSILATDGGQCSTIFSLSYNHLPAYLKPCFLYFAIFPEDYDIRRSELIKLWIAEGFIKPNESKSLEDIAEECLEDLLNRSLIMVFKLGQDGKVKTYRIHDLLRDFCITKVQKEKFLHVTNMYNIHSEGIRSERRVSIQPVTPLEFIEYTFNSNGPSLPTRSLLLYHQDAEIIISEHSFGLLRVLNMRSGKWLCEFPVELVRLVHLRYLSFRCLEVIVPGSISSIWGLQTLIIDAWNYIDLNHLPLQVWTMPHLRHVQIRNTFCRLLDPPNSGVEGESFVILANLQTLSTIRNFRFTDEVVKRIPKLKKLKVFYDKNVEDWSHFHLSNIVCLNELETLRITSYSQVEFPRNFKFPAALKKLTLSRCHLPWEVMAMVGSLHNLEVLTLKRDACKGEVWEPNEGEFRKLKFLRLYLLDLVHWRADDSHFPKLECLKIHWCFNLKEIPIEIGNIQTLEMIELDQESPLVVASAELILNQQQSFGNDVLQICIEDMIEFG
ncbi:putative late blight resistance protein homolog R1B-17 [Primulina eburnea]|uniref:putative late blight resistance protein homolog R1B-17 n=1 Tax=Primulina eburnea TaxID=1245227 RepID=UPI003C6C9153